ncbi:VOC family protein [Ottowia thiooxydans]|uniref:VOC family protein n=1 Tax=Ottowia thiooxydans TaxID=219182 RepID=UPI0004238B5E|nr:VOC family protein [Ottowia thiooxydans]
MLCKQFHHVAYRCKDAKQTVDFYTRMLGLKFSHVMGADHVPSTGLYSPHIHIFFELEDGSNIAFFECPHDPGEVKDLTSPDWIQHIAFRVADLQTLEAAKKDLESKGIKVLGPTVHDDFVTSIYFWDPSGHRLELTSVMADQQRMKRYEEEAPRALEVWNRTHDWSNRREAFGADQGYAHRE